MNRRDLIKASMTAGAGLALPRYAQAAVQRSYDDWRPLFNGKNLDGWTFYQDGIGDRDLHGAVKINQRMLHILGPKYTRADAPPGHVATTSEYQNFHLRLDFRWGTRVWPPRLLHRRNSGILYHMAPERDRLFPDCVEYQIQEGDVGDAIMLNTLSVHGPVLGGTPMWPNWIPAFSSAYVEPLRSGTMARQWHRHSGNYERLDGWNRLEVFAFEDQAAHLVNGRIVNTLYHIKRTDAAGNRAPLTGGRIALEIEWAEAFFRDVLIRPLDAAAIARIRKQGSD